MRKADVIIPTFKPGDKLEKLLRRLLEQSDHHEYGRKVLGC